MFLAINELIKEKSRFALITVVIILVSYLVFFLLALAYGLASSYTQAIDKWGATSIALSENSNNSINRSVITHKEYSGLIPSKDTATANAAPLGVGAATVIKEESEDVTLFGIDTASFLAPEPSEGRGIKASNEIIVSSELSDLKLNDTIKLQGEDQNYTVVGITTEASFQASPVIYMSLADWRFAASAASGMTGMRDDSSISAVVLKDDQSNSGSLTRLSIKDFINTLPGYQAQVLTFSLMIGFLIAIAAFVLAIFIYILTLQKKGIFGVLKAEGIPNKHIASSVIIQVGILSVGGLAIGMGLALLTGALLTGKVPFAINPIFFTGISGLFLACAALGALASVRSVTKIDPVEAIG